MIFVLIFCLMITRLVGLSWGFPYLFHPDENNITSSLLQLSCSQFSIFHLSNCFDPHFYAYGELYTHLGRLVSWLISLFLNRGTLTALSASLALRTISALSSILTGWVIYRWILKEFREKSLARIGLLLYIFTPVFIQFAHFGTTESLLILLFVALLYFRRSFYLAGLLVGFSIAIKISSMVLLVVPVIQIILTKFSLRSKLRLLTIVGLIALVTFILLTPHYWLNFGQFYNSLVYEASVASGRLPVFYTEQFRSAIPIVFPFLTIFPSALGIPLLSLGVVGFLTALKQKRFYTLITGSLFLYQSLFYAQWTRFYLYIYPLFIYWAVLSTARLDNSRFRLRRVLIAIFLAVHVLSGIAYFSIYLKTDTRVMAGQFLSAVVPKQTPIISESANVADIPGLSSLPKHQSYFLYDLDTNSSLANKIMRSLKRAKYVVVDSRRVFHNYTDYYFKDNVLHFNPTSELQKRYPAIFAYYHEVFNPQKFELLQTFSSYPGIGPWRWIDENSEETFSVFDHPVVRVYRRVAP